MKPRRVYGVPILVFAAAALIPAVVWAAQEAQAPQAVPPTEATQPDELASARTLYEQAQYEDALAILDRLTDSSPDGAVRPGQNLVAEYRALCLLALGRTEDAERALEPLLTKKPLYQPQSGDAPPRFNALVASVRVRVLPAAIRARYRAARQSYDAGDRAEAEQGFRDVVLWSQWPELDLETRGSVQDLAVLAEGFATLIASTKSNADSTRAESTAPVPPPTGAPPSPTGARPGSAAAKPASPATVRGESNGQDQASPVFGPEDADVEAPVLVRRTVPAWPVNLGTAPFDSKRVILELIVGLTGDVESVDMKGTVSPFYDPLLVQAARSWLFRPARREGVAVRYRKPVIVTVTPNARQSPE